MLMDKQLVQKGVVVRLAQPITVEDQAQVSVMT
jgi:hypothetical protein